MNELLLGLALLLSVAWLILRIRRGRIDVAESRKAGRDTGVSDSPYHAVSIKYSSDACDAAKAAVGTRFLASAAPRLPLPDCDAPVCNCQFVHHADRRSGKDRRSPFNPATYGGTGSFQVERRDRRDRRRPPGAASF